MARKPAIAIQDTIETEDEFKSYLKKHNDTLICVEVYSGFCGPCLATQNAIRRGKLEIGGDDIVMVKCQADHIAQLARFKDKSEPVFLFIFKGKLTRAMFGANAIELTRLIQQELGHQQLERQGVPAFSRHEIEELLPEEAQKMEEDRIIEEEHRLTTQRLRVLTTAARKKRAAERMAPALRHYNFILFWPHCHKAHYELYMKWDAIDVTVAAKEEIQFTEELAAEVLYMSDVDPNEACMHSLMNGEALVVLFKMFERDERDFVELLRHTLYVEVPEPKEDIPPDMQPPPIPSFERYASVSKSARQVRRERHNAHLEQLAKEQEERDRIAAEQARIEREKEEDRLREEKQKKEEERMARIQAGLPPDPEPEEDEAVAEEKVGEEGTEAAEAATEATEPTEATEATDATEPTVEGAAADIAEGEEAEPEEKVQEEEEVFHSDVEVEDEPYIPPEGLFVPGLYTPPNNLAKVNAMVHLFPKVVTNLIAIETEFLPPHVLVMFPVDKRNEVKEIMDQFQSEILYYGIFEGEDPFQAEHLAYTIKQYDLMSRTKRHKDRLAIAVSRKRSLPLLQLAGFNPTYISSDIEAGERDCLNLFPVGYGDEYFEEESVQEEELVMQDDMPAGEGGEAEVEAGAEEGEAAVAAESAIAAPEESTAAPPAASATETPTAAAEPPAAVAQTPAAAPETPTTASPIPAVVPEPQIAAPVAVPEPADRTPDPAESAPEPAAPAPETAAQAPEAAPAPEAAAPAPEAAAPAPEAAAPAPEAAASAPEPTSPAPEVASPAPEPPAEPAPETLAAEKKEPEAPPPPEPTPPTDAPPA